MKPFFSCICHCRILLGFPSVIVCCCKDNFPSLPLCLNNFCDISLLRGTECKYNKCLLSQGGLWCSLLSISHSLSVCSLLPLANLCFEALPLSCYTFKVCVFWHFQSTPISEISQRHWKTLKNMRRSLVFLDFWPALPCVYCSWSVVCRWRWRLSRAWGSSVLLG